MGKQTTLAELATVHDQKLPLRVDVAEAKAATLPGPETEAVAESEDGAVGRPAADGPRVVAERCGRRDQLTGLSRVEQERQASRGLSPSSHAQRRLLQTLLGHGPVEEATQDRDEVVEAAGPRPGPGGDELIEQLRRELAQTRHPVLVGKDQQ